MLRLFNSTKTLYLTMCVFGTIFFSVSIIMNASLVLVIPMLVIWIVIAATVSTVIANKKLSKITKILIDDCNVQEHIEIYLKLLKKVNDKSQRTFVLLSLSAGYLNFGDNVAGKKILDLVQYFPDTRAGAINKVCYYNNLCEYYLQVKDTLHAADMLGKMMAALNDPKTPIAIRDRILQNNNKQICINMGNGNFDGAEQAFILTFQKEQHFLDKAYAKYMLGRIYLHQKKYDQANDAFGYAIEYGGDSRYARESAVYLKQLSVMK